MSKEIIKSIKEKLSKEEVDFILNNDINLKRSLIQDNLNRERVDDDSVYYTINLGSSNLNQKFYDNCDYDGFNYINYNYFKTEQEAIKYAKIIKNNLKILQTLEYINDGWKSDLTNVDKTKYAIVSCRNVVIDDYAYVHHKILSFQSEEKRSQFRQMITDEEIKLFLNPLGEN